MLGIIGKGLYENGNKIIAFKGRLINLRPWGSEKVVEATKRSPAMKVDILPATQEEFAEALKLGLVSSKNVGELPIEVESVVKAQLAEFVTKNSQYAARYAEVKSKIETAKA